jgi:acyl transferase domain-containing protein/acyl-CoA synthetase (AMP-forming)/AMP-acid ligase II/acyl carrier protein
MKSKIGYKDSFVECLRLNSARRDSHTAFVFLERGEEECGRLTFGQLDQRARAIASVLQDMTEPGARALLLYPSGLDFIAAFFGCLYAGVVAVPTFDPRRLRSTTRVTAIAEDAGARLVLTVDSIRAGQSGASKDSGLNPWGNATVIATDTIENSAAAGWREFEPGRESLALLQYTSGSTGRPKGVMVTHGNLVANSEMVRVAFDHSDETVFVSWLPQFHDMGLIGCILQPVYLGIPGILMSPADFVQKPVRWLRAISKYRATTTGGSNSGYDACVRKVTAEERESLDLSSLRVAFNGAEPVRASTLRAFSEAFKPCGLRPEAMYPCYGLAEATLFVSGATPFEKPVFLDVDGQRLDEGEARQGETSGNARTLTGCGRAWLGQKIVIADPESLLAQPEGRIGEVWVSGENVTHGYWQRPEESEQTFRARLAGSFEETFLRTGDLGFIKDGELFIVSRIKDLIIIRGRNHYPPDIETTIESCHPAIQPNAIAAFSIDAEGEERLAIVCEIRRNAVENVNASEVTRAIKRAVARDHEIEVYSATLVQPSTIPKTSSGKIQRQACKRAVLSAQGLDVIEQWRQKDASAPEFSSVAPPFSRDIQFWLIETVSSYLGISSREVDPREEFTSLGLDSEKAVRLAGALQEWLGKPLPATLVYEFPTIEVLSRHLSGEVLPAAAERAADNRPSDNEPIAIVGMACKFPGATNLDQYWELLRNGVDAIGFLPDSRRGARDWGQAVLGGFIDGVDQFDAEFFGVSPREAEMMDPQQRILLEVAWTALENAGIAPHGLAGTKTGVFVGISNPDYSKLMAGREEVADPYFGTGAALSIAANRLSYFLDLRGPSWAVDTACSSSLVAVHQACQSLRWGECNLALVGGVNLILAPELTHAFARTGMMSPGGRCKTFDKDADGYVRGEGCGVIVLKSHGAALRDGDQVLALIKGSSVNQDGRTNGLTAPNGPAQQAVITEALVNAGITPAGVDYVEAHGTGTQLGDPIEMKSIATALCDDRRDGHLRVGSVKTNIGHLESAAGMAGLIKVVLALGHGEIPPHLHLKEISPLLAIEGARIQIPTAIAAWPAQSGRRVAGISSFGFGGTNAHVIVERAEEPRVVGTEPTLERPLHLLTLSARTDQALNEAARQFGAHIKASSDSIGDIAFSANAGRSHFDQRLAMVVRSTDDAPQLIESFLSGAAHKDVFRGEVVPATKPVIAFVFTGQGSQYVGMGRDLFYTQPIFRRTLESCDELLRPLLKEPLLDVMYGSAENGALLDHTEYTQPALFALEYALAELWKSWGISPALVMGHSVGEYVAACVAGVFSLEDGLRLIAERARLMQALPGNGGMASVFASADRVRDFVEPHSKELSIAAMNSPKQTVISGSLSALDVVTAEMKNAGVGFSRLAVSHAFHSPLMTRMLGQFREIANQINYARPRIGLVSNVTGSIGSDVANGGYWMSHIVSPVNYAAGMETLHRHGYDALIEIGPKPTLLTIAKECIAPDGKLWLPSLRAKRPNWATLLESLAALYVRGAAVDWNGFDRGYARLRVALPNYPFQRRRYWIEETARPMEVEHPVLGRRMPPADNGHGPRVWQVELSDRTHPYLKGHRVFGSAVVPYSVYVEMALSAAREAFDEGFSEISGMQLHNTVRIPEGGSATLRITLSEESGGDLIFRTYNRTNRPNSPAEEWKISASARVRSANALSDGAINEVRANAVFQ